MSYEEVIGRRVNIKKNKFSPHIGMTGKVVGIDTRPIGYGDGDYLIINLENKKPNDPQLGIARAQQSEVEFLEETNAIG